MEPMPSDLFQFQSSSNSYTHNGMDANHQAGRYSAYINFHQHNSYNNLGYSNTPPVTDPQYHDGHQYSPTVASPTITSKKSSQKFTLCPPVKRNDNIVSIKSKIGVEYRRYAVSRDDIIKFEDFFNKIQSIHQLHGTSFTVSYTDQDGELLPINNDDNLAKAIAATPCLHSTRYIVASSNQQPYRSAIQHPNHIQPYHNYHQHQQRPQLQQVILIRPYLKLYLQKKGIPNDFYYMSDITFKCKRKDNLINMLMSSSSSTDNTRPLISEPEDFRQVSSIIDADKLPATRRRVVLKRGGSDKPLGFYIRDGIYHRMNSQGIIEKNYGVFISRLVPGGLAESTNLLAENDEILEVNGIEIGRSKRLDQVRDMMVANSSNLIITTRPAKPYSQYNANYYNRPRTKTVTNSACRDRLPSTQSNCSDLGEDFIRHHID